MLACPDLMPQALNFVLHVISTGKLSPRMNDAWGHLIVGNSP
jgi:hypothetical protein